MTQRHHLSILARLACVPAVLALAALACSQPTPAPKPTATVALAANEISFTQLLYTSYLKPGDTLPGSGVQYVGQSGDSFQLLIDGQQANKKALDSLYWKGQPAQGVTLEYNLRILGVFLDQFEASGPVNIIIADPAPQAGGTLPENAPIHFAVDIANTTAKVGANIPGTTIGYAGKTDKGGQLTGVEGYPYRQTGDSIDWTGQVRPNVWLKLNLRVRAVADDSLSAFGTGEVWIVTP